MKYRKGFVTNSSSSSFILSIQIGTNDGEWISFEANGGVPETGRIDYFSCDAVVTVSPKQLGEASTVEELINLLTEGVIDECEWEENQNVKIFEKSNPVVSDAYFDDDDEDDETAHTYDAYDFIKEIREKVKTMDDISRIIISGEEVNYREYNQTYIYDRKSGRYTGSVLGCEFEKDGASGGALYMPDLDMCDVEYTEWVD